MGMNSSTRRQQKLAKEKGRSRKIAAKKEKRASLVPTIFLDESGNTGANLVDKQQPFFAMAGVNFSQAEAERLLTLVNSKSPKEVHFSNFKRRRSGQEALLRLLEHSLIKKDNVKVCVFHKQFMVTTKIVDLLIEYMANETGFDLYENGANIALSNMLHYCMPTFCGEENVTAMQKLFIEMIKKKDAEAINAFYESVGVLKEKSISEKFNSDLDMILITKNLIDDALSNVDRTNLDPLIPSLFSQCVEWGKEYSKGFHVIHDDSKTLEMKQILFGQFMDLTSIEMEVGYDRRKFKLPLRGKSLNFASSETYPQLQVADVVASAISYWANGVYGGEKDDVFFQELDKLNFRRLIISNIWPSLDVTPQSLGTVHDGGINPADGSAYFLTKARTNSPKFA